MFAVSASIQTKPAVPPAVVVPPMVLQMDTTAANEVITLPADGNVVLHIDWGDGTVEDATTDNPTHTYAARGSHTIKIGGTVDHFGFANAGDNTKLTAVTSFGNFAPTSWAGAFHGCSRLTSVAKMGKVHTENCTDMSGMFYLCGALSSLDVTEFDTGNVVTVRNMFGGCRVLAALDVTNFDTSKVLDFYAMFQNCRALTVLDVSNFDTSSGANFANLFYYCLNLTVLDVSNFDTSNAVSFQKMFYVCQKVTALDVSNFDTRNATDFSHMFNNCKVVAALDVSNFNTSKAMRLDRMFYKCERVKALDLTHFNTALVTGMDEMLYSCHALTDADISGFSIASLVAPGCNDMFYISLRWPDAQYQKMLNAWSKQATIPANIKFLAGDAKYGTAKPARDILTGAPNNWQITDGGA